MSAKKRTTPKKINAVKDTANTLRELKNWIFIFAKEYDLPDEAVTKLHEKVDEVAEKLKNV